ncbi:DUF3566 domain-containing protein [Phycicoccus sp. HDW14]|uniref:DUF3566 domain-containing protein n=1 Tax=Phycicoccus sp. HDW14 TaxID=2714941 RepID=UPI001F0D9537|nr:DUF3566 domain-containing protein [Phycicoccus sp. HDW14]
MSTADSAGRPVRSSTQPRRGEGGALKRLADPGQSTRPVPTGREAAPAGREASPTRPTAAPGRTGEARTGGERTVPQTGGAPRPSSRRVRLTVSRIDPWSAMKVSFLLSVALGIALVIATVVLWTVLDAMGVFDEVNGVIGQVVQDGGSKFDILDFIGFTRVVSLSIVLGVVDVILFTAIATLGAFLYNVSAALVGGVQLTLTDD